MRVGAHDQRQRLPVAELVIAPLMEPAKDRVEALFGVPFQVAEYSDIARVADLLRQVGGIVDVLGLEIGVILLALQEAKVHRDTEVLEAAVDEAGVAGLVPRPVPHQLLDVGIFKVFLDLVI